MTHSQPNSNRTTTKSGTRVHYVLLAILFAAWGTAVLTELNGVTPIYAAVSVSIAGILAAATVIALD